MRAKVLKRTKELNRKLYKTTSFSLLKTDHEEFLKVCDKLDRLPSDVIRELIKIFTEEKTDENN